VYIDYIIYKVSKAPHPNLHKNISAESSNFST